MMSIRYIMMGVFLQSIKEFNFVTLQNDVAAMFLEDHSFRVSGVSSEEGPALYTSLGHIETVTRQSC